MCTNMQNHKFVAPILTFDHGCFLLTAHIIALLVLRQMGFFRRRYREIIEAEKNRKDSDESWDWMEKNHWDLRWGGPRGANEIRDWVGKDPIARGLAAQPPQWHQWPFSLPYVEEKNILHIFWSLDIFLWVGVQETGFWGDSVACQRTLAVEFS